MQMSNVFSDFSLSRLVRSNTLLFVDVRPSPREHVLTLRLVDEISTAFNNGTLPSPHWKGKVKHYEREYKQNPINSAKPRTGFKKRK